MLPDGKILFYNNDIHYYSNKYNKLVNNHSILHLEKSVSNTSSVLPMFTSEEYTNFKQILIYTTIASNHAWHTAHPRLNDVYITNGSCQYQANGSYNFYTTLYILNDVIYFYSGSSFYDECTTNLITQKTNLTIDYGLYSDYVVSCNSEIYIA